MQVLRDVPNNGCVGIALSTPVRTLCQILMVEFKQMGLPGYKMYLSLHADNTQSQAGIILKAQPHKVHLVINELVKFCTLWLFNYILHEFFN